jgi:hypothetical protein
MVAEVQLSKAKTRYKHQNKGSNSSSPSLQKFNNPSYFVYSQKKLVLVYQWKLLYLVCCYGQENIFSVIRG